MSRRPGGDQCPCGRKVGLLDGIAGGKKAVALVERVRGGEEAARDTQEKGKYGSSG